VVRAALHASPARTLALLVLAVALPLAAARGDVKRYRYELEARSGDPAFASGLPLEKIPVGPWREVERDAKGRLVRDSRMRDAAKEGETLYRYAGEAELPEGAEEFAFGQHTGSLKFQRNEKGYRTRVDWLTVSGTPTAYESRTYGPDSVEKVYCAADGTVKTRIVNTYSDKGGLVGVRTNAETAYYEALVNPETGQPISRKKTADGKVAMSSKYAYDANGEMLREDGFSADGVLYVSVEFTQGLQTRKNYTFPGGFHKEITVTYDEKRLAQESRMYVNGKLICSFIYERFPDNTTRRTVAVGPDGDSWAQYPNRAVNEVSRSGQSLDRTDAVIYHSGSWW
jgi:hypothetical protein